MTRGTFAAGAVYSAATAVAGPSDSNAIAAIERRWGGRIGCTAHDLRTGRRIEHRANESFPLASTQKLPLAMTVLTRAAAKKVSLEQTIAFTKADLVHDSKIAAGYPAGGALRVDVLLSQMIVSSDNTAADLLAKLVGGPAATTAYLREIGIRGVRIDRLERDLPRRANRSDVRDSGTPAEMTRLVEMLAARSPLPASSTALLLSWMRLVETGDDRLRAGVPAGWAVADKTGSYANASNDVGLLYPPAGPPIAIAVYAFEQPDQTARNRAIAACAKSVVSAFRQ